MLNWNHKKQTKTDKSTDNADNCVKTRSARFETPYDVNKIDFYYNTEDEQAALCNSFVVYDFSCADCDANYIDKTES